MLELKPFTILTGIGGEETFGFSGFASNRKVCYRELRINFGGFMFGSVSVGLEIHFLSFFNFRIIK